MHWFCIHTRPAKEQQAVQYCSDVLRVQTYFPRLQCQRVIRRVKRVVTRPLFPRYFFCRIDPAQHFRALRYAPEVIDVVSFGGQPAIVPEEVITTLQGWAGETVDLLQFQTTCRVGDHVRIVNGPLRGLEAVVCAETKDPERVAVLLSILSCGARVTINRSDLERVA